MDLEVKMAQDEPHSCTHPTRPGEPCLVCAKKTRFFIDHEVIHDSETGKHVVTDGEWPFEDDLPSVLALLNGLSEKTVTNLQHKERAKDLALRLDEGLGLVVASPEGADVYLGDLITMGTEISDLLREIADLPSLKPR